MRRYIVLETDEKFPELEPEDFYVIRDDFYDPEILALVEETLR